MTTERQKRRRDERRTNGLCPVCGKAREDDRYIMCESCRQYIRGASKILRQRREASRLCWSCGKQLKNDEKHKSCFECRRARAKARQSKGEEHETDA